MNTFPRTSFPPAPRIIGMLTLLEILVGRLAHLGARLGDDRLTAELDTLALQVEQTKKAAVKVAAAQEGE